MRKGTPPARGAALLAARFVSTVPLALLVLPTVAHAQTVAAPSGARIEWQALRLGDGVKVDRKEGASATGTITDLERDEFGDALTLDDRVQIHRYDVVAIRVATPAELALAKPPPVVEAPRRARSNQLLIAGGATFSAAYLAAAVSAGVSGEAAIAVPVGGPIYEAVRLVSLNEQCTGLCVGNAFRSAGAALLVMDALAQVLGLLLATGGVALRLPSIDAPAVTLAPTAGPSAVGITFDGRF